MGSTSWTRCVRVDRSKILTSPGKFEKLSAFSRKVEESSFRALPKESSYAVFFRPFSTVTFSLGRFAAAAFVHPSLELLWGILKWISSLEGSGWNSGTLDDVLARLYRSASGCGAERPCVQELD